MTAPSSLRTQLAREAALGLDFTTRKALSQVLETRSAGRLHLDPHTGHERHPSVRMANRRFGPASYLESRPVRGSFGCLVDRVGPIVGIHPSARTAGRMAPVSVVLVLTSEGASCSKKAWPVRQPT
jgi:hypothetical protein